MRGNLLPRAAIAVVLQLTLLPCVILGTALPSSTPQLLLQGRFGGANKYGAAADSLPVLFSWASSSVFITFQSTAVNLTLTALPASIAYSGYNRFTIQIDQEVVATESQDLDNTVIQWGTSGLSQGVHNLTITKLNEPAYGEATLDAVMLGHNGM